MPRKQVYSACLRTLQGSILANGSNGCGNSVGKNGRYRGTINYGSGGRESHAECGTANYLRAPFFRAFSFSARANYSNYADAFHFIFFARPPDSVMRLKTRLLVRFDAIENQAQELLCSERTFTQMKGENSR